MPKLRIDGCRGTISITCGVGAHELCDHLYPEDNLPRVFFHTELPYVQLVDTVSDCIILCEVPRSYYCWDDSSKSGPCYLTTACVEIMGLEDDCDELETLRAFRDKLMTGSFKDCEKVADYYEQAPAIVRKLDKRVDKNAFYSHVYYEFIIPAVEAVKAGDTARALEIYTQGVLHCKKGAEEVDDAAS